MCLLDVLFLVIKSASSYRWSNRNARFDFTSAFEINPYKSIVDGVTFLHYDYVTANANMFLVFANGTFTAPSIDVAIVKDRTS